MIKRYIIVAIGLFFVVAGVLHFFKPESYVSIVPSYLPFPRTLVLISGACEIAGGIGLWLPRFRRMAGWGLIALLVAVFPANIYMLTNHPYTLGKRVPEWLLWLRLPLQPALIALIYWSAKRSKSY